MTTINLLLYQMKNIKLFVALKNNEINKHNRNKQMIKIL